MLLRFGLRGGCAEPAARRHRREVEWAAVVLATYRRTQGDPWEHADAVDVADDLGWTFDEVYRVGHDLVERGLLEYHTSGPTWLLTTDGMDAAERTMLADDSGEPDELKERVRWLQAARTRVLLAIHAATAGEPSGYTTDTETKANAEVLDPHEYHGLVKWLSDRYLVKPMTTEYIAITTHGTDLVEEAEELPDEPATPGLVSYNIIQVTDSPHATVNAIQGSPGAVLPIVSDTSDLDELRALLATIGEELVLDDDAAMAMAAVEARAERGETRSGVVPTGLGKLAAFAGDVGSDVLAAAIVAYLKIAAS